MVEEEIARLFLQAAGHSAQKTEDVRRVFAILVRSTLLYRDRIRDTCGTVVTVGDVREALKWLLPALATGNLPETDCQISLGLLKVWLEELAVLGYPKIRN